MFVDGSELKRAWAEARPSAASDYSLVSARDPWFVGASREGYPTLLRRLARRPADSTRIMGAVRVRLLGGVEIELDGQRRTTDLAALECLDPALMETFVVLGLDVIKQVGDGDATSKDVLNRVAQWRELLTNQQVMEPHEQLGLWGELELLSRFGVPQLALEAWNGPDREALDFARNLVGLEVKTSTKRRVHSLRWSQGVFGETSHDSYLVSLHAQLDPSGRSLPDQVEQVASVVSDRYLFRSKLLRAGYRDDQAANYDARWILVDDPVAFVMSEVPRFATIPDGVFDVRWRVDLSSRRPLASTAFASLLQMFVG